MMSPLPLDMPDDYPWLPSSTRYPLADLGEQAVRLGSPVTFDRRGEVVWFDVCDKGLAPYDISGSGTGNKVEVSVFYPLHGGYNLQLTAGSDADHLSQINKLVSNLAMRQAGVEVAFFVTEGVEKFYIHLARHTGIQETISRIQVDCENLTLSYLGSDNAYHSFADISEPRDNWGVYHHLKMAMDYDRGSYLRVIYDEKQYDLSDYALFTGSSVQIACYRLYCRITGRLDFNDTAYIGHVIVTGNEP